MRSGNDKDEGKMLTRHRGALRYFQKGFITDSGIGSGVNRMRWRRSYIKGVTSSWNALKGLRPTSNNLNTQNEKPQAF
ncbi:hypothetical protein SESI111939_08790 [Serratia silvae]